MYGDFSGVLPGKEVYISHLSTPAVRQVIHLCDYDRIWATEDRNDLSLRITSLNHKIIEEKYDIKNLESDC